MGNTYMSGRQHSNSMFNVQISTPKKPNEKSFQIEPVKLENSLDTFSSTGTQMIVDSSDIPTPYPCLTARLTLLHLNAATLNCSSLAICVALFSTLLNLSLQSATDNADLVCALTNDDESFLTMADLMRNQTYRSMNATMWNLQQVAFFGIDSAMQSYELAAKGAYQIHHGTNATHGLGQPTVSSISKVGDKKKLLFDSLQDVERTLESSTCLNSMFNNESNTLNGAYSIGSTESIVNNHFNCNTLSSITLEAIKGVQMVTEDAQNDLAVIMSKSPSIDGEQLSNATRSIHESDFGIMKTTRTWVIVFSVAAILAMIPNGYKEYSCWHQQLASVKESREYPQFNILENFYTLKHFGGNLLSTSLSRLIICSDRYACKAWVKWAVNYAFSSNLNRLLQSGIFLAILTIANSTILSSARVPHSDCRQQPQVTQSFYAFQQELNRKLLSLISQVLKDLDSNHAKLIESLKTAANDSWTTLSPFTNGVALAEIIILPSPPRQLTNSGKEPNGIHMADVLNTINSTIWISSLVVLAIWAIFAGCACGWAAYKVCKVCKVVNTYGSSY